MSEFVIVVVMERGSGVSHRIVSMSSLVTRQSKGCRIPFRLLDTKGQCSYFDVGRGGALVESKLFDRRVVSSNPALATT